MRLKVELLVRDELLFELVGRGVETWNTQSTVQDLRKLLRTHQDAAVDVRHFHKKLIIDEELGVIEEKLLWLEDYIKVLSVHNVSRVLRAETKVSHLELRCRTVLQCKTHEDKLKVCQEYLDRVLVVQDHVKGLGVAEDVKERVFRKLSETLAEEDSLDDVFTHLDCVPDVNITNSVPVSVTTASYVQASPSNMPSHSGIATSTSHVNLTPIMSLGCNVNNVARDQYIPEQFVHSHQANTSMFTYGKLENPVNKHLQTLKVTNGLNPTDLLAFMKVMLKLSGDLKLPDHIVLELCVGHSSGPLLGKLLEMRSKALTIAQVHVELLRYLLPVNMIDNLRVSLVNRPQRVGEELAMYIAEIKENARVLCCYQSEVDLVQVIKNGIAPHERNRLIFLPNPNTFADLDQLCIQSQNMFYADNVRQSEHMKNKARYVNHNVNSQTPEYRPRVCYLCHRPGHIAKFCHHKNKGTSNPKNM